MFRKIVKNTFWISLSHIVNILGNFVAIILITNYLGVKLFGIYSFAFAFCFFFNITLDLGIRSYIFREIPREPNKLSYFIFNGIIAKLFLFLLNSIVFFLIFYFSNFSILKKNTLLIVYFIVFSDSLLQFFIQSFLGLEEASTSTLIKTLNKILYLLFLFIVIYKLKGKIYHVLLSNLLSIIITTSIAFYLLKTRHLKNIKITSKFITMLIKKSLPFGMAAILSAIYFRIDMIMLSFMKGDISIGYYSPAYRLVEVIMFIPGSLATAIAPNFSREYIKSPDSLRQKFNFAFNIFLNFGFILLIFYFRGANFIIELLYKPEFLPSIKALKILAFAGFFMSLNYIMGTMLYAVNLENKAVLNSLICSILNISLNFYFIKKYDFYGAAFTTVLTEALLFFLMWYEIGRKSYLLKLDKISTLMFIIYIADFFILRLIKFKSIIHFISITIGLIILSNILLYTILPTKKKNFLKNLLKEKI